VTIQLSVMPVFIYLH